MIRSQAIRRSERRRPPQRPHLAKPDLRTPGGFHSHPRPADFVYLFPTARSFIYADSDLVSSNVVIFPAFQGLVREKGSNRLDGSTVYNVFYTGAGPRCVPDAGPIGTAWETNNQPWGVTGGLIYVSAAPSGIGNMYIPDNGYANNDVAVDVKTGAGQAGVVTHGPNDNDFVLVYLDIPSLRVKAAMVKGKAVNTVVFTGTTPIVANTSYRLRAAEASNGTVSVYLDGVLEGTFSLVGVDYGPGFPVMSYHTIGLATSDASARFHDFYVAPHAAMTATDYTIRNYDGDIVYTNTIAGLADPTQITIPDSSLKQRSNRGPYGWYRMYLTGPDHYDGIWKTAYGDCAFCRIPTIASGFAANALISQGAPGFSDQGIDEYARGVMGIGPARYNLSSDPTLSVANAANAEVFAGAPILKTSWVDTGFSLRPRKIIGAFANGTTGIETSIVTPTVNALKASIKAWETLNEPNFFMPAADFVNNQLIPFYNAVKAEDPTAYVLAPAVVSFNPSALATYYVDFFNAGGGNYCDAISVHAYNCFNGDMTLARLCLSTLRYVMALYSFTKPIYQTEQGFAWEYAGLIYPRYSGRWTALMWFMSELYGMPVDNNAYWYDSPIGFDTFPMYWTSQAGIGPQPVPIRTMIAEIGNRSLTAQFDFGTYGNSLYAGGTWTAGDGSKTVGLMATSYGQRDLLLDVSGASSITCVDTWGNTFVLSVVAGRVTFPISEMPQWVRCPAGVTVTPVALNLTTNLALTSTVTSNGVPDPGDSGGGNTYASLSNTDTTVINNDIQDNQYEGTPYSNPYGGSIPNPYHLRAPNLPFTITLTWGAPVTMNRVILHAFPPWQTNGIPTAMTIDTWDGASWTTRYTKTAPALKTFPFMSGAARCTYETFFDEQWVFDASFSAISASKVRVVISDATIGSGEPGAYDALWGAWQPGTQNGTPKSVTVREIQVFNATDPAPPPTTFIRQAATRAGTW